MHSTLLALSLFTAALAAAGCTDQAPAAGPGSTTSAAAPAGASGALTVQAGTGTERFPVSGVAVRVTSCSADSVAATLTTSKDGTATQKLSAGCYRAAVTTVPSGCQPDAVADTTAEVELNDTTTVRFLIHCA
jgi:hypothetical protein